MPAPWCAHGAAPARSPVPPPSWLPPHPGPQLQPCSLKQTLIRQGRGIWLLSINTTFAPSEPNVACRGMQEQKQRCRRQSVRRAQKALRGLCLRHTTLWKSPEFKPDLLSYPKPHVVSPSPKLKPGWMKMTGNRIKQINDTSACTDPKQLSLVVAKV